LPAVHDDGAFTDVPTLHVYFKPWRWAPRPGGGRPNRAARL